MAANLPKSNTTFVHVLGAFGSSKLRETGFYWIDGMENRVRHGDLVGAWDMTKPLVSSCGPTPAS